MEQRADADRGWTMDPVINYYKLDSGLIFRTRDSDEAYYIEKLIDGKWIDDGDLMKYIFDGEPGATPLSQAEISSLPK